MAQGGSTTQTNPFLFLLGQGLKSNTPTPTSSKFTPSTAPTAPTTFYQTPPTQPPGTRVSSSAPQFYQPIYRQAYPDYTFPGSQFGVSSYGNPYMSGYNPYNTMFNNMFNPFQTGYYQSPTGLNYYQTPVNNYGYGPALRTQTDQIAARQSMMDGYGNPNANNFGQQVAARARQGDFEGGRGMSTFVNALRGDATDGIASLVDQ